MKEWTVVYEDIAIKDLEDFIFYCSPSEASERFVWKMINQIETLAQNPYRYRSIPNRSHFRRMLYRPFQIFYKVEEAEKTVRIMRVWHSAREFWK